MQILTLLMHVTEGQHWRTNKERQKEFTQALEGLGLKSGGAQRDRNPGGPRTYEAQLEGLGLLFGREDGTIWPTLAGTALLEERRPLEVMQTQLLRYQYPSVYGSGIQVRIHPDLHVRPFIFLLRLITDPDLNGLRNTEFGIPVIYGHNDACYELCKSKILQWRSEGGDGLDQIDHPEVDLVTPRTMKDRRKTKDWEKAWGDFKDVGNTFKNALESNALVEKDPETQRLVVTEENLARVQDALADGEPLLTLTSEESFQRSFGRFDRAKDTRQLGSTRSRSEVQNGSSMVLARFLTHCQETLVTDSFEHWVTQTGKTLGISSESIRRTIAPYLDRATPIFEQTYLDLSRGGTIAGLDFEKATAEILRSKLGFEVTLTGQKKRNGIGGYTDLLLLPDGDSTCAIVDTKASGCYSLGSSDYHKMKGNYIPHYHELAPQRTLEFCGYIAGGLANSVATTLQTLKKEVGIPAMAMSAQTLLTFAKKDPEIAQRSFREACREGGVVTAD